MAIPTAELQRVKSAVVRRCRRVERKVWIHAMGFGTTVRCPNCGWSGRQFAPSANPRRANRICPVCFSNERYRALEAWLRARATRPGERLLEIAPIELVRPTATELGMEYVSLDLKSARALVLGDLCDLPFSTAAFDVVVCFHVLEHVPDDAAAMAELGRIVKAGGDLVIVVPWDQGRRETFEDPDTDPADYERVYGQSDHVRIYGADFSGRLRAAGLEVDEVMWSTLFTPAEYATFALDGPDDRFWICRTAEA